MKKTILRVVAFCIRRVYEIMILFRTQPKVTLISRQADEAPADFVLIQSQLMKIKPDLKVRILTRKLRLGSPGMFFYPFHMIRQLYHIATSKVVVLDGYCMAASIPALKNDVKVVQIWHATAAIKKFGWQTVGKPSGSDADTAGILKMHGNYDYVLAPSTRTGEIYKEAFRVDEGQLVYGGLPHLSTLVHPDTDVMKSIRDAYGLDPGKKIILYIPTFRDGKCIRFEGLSLGVDFDRYELVVRVHPLDSLPSHMEGVVTADKFTTQEWMQLADIIITDYSSLMVEAAILGKPLFLYVYDIEEYGLDPGLNLDLNQEEIRNVVFRDADRLLLALDEPYDFELLARFRDEYIKTDPRDAARTFGKFLANLTEKVDTNEKES